VISEHIRCAIWWGQCVPLFTACTCLYDDSFTLLVVTLTEHQSLRTIHCTLSFGSTLFSFGLVDWFQYLIECCIARPAWLVGLALTRYLTTLKMFMLINADHFATVCSIVHSRVQTVTGRLAEICTGRSGCVVSVRLCASVSVCVIHWFDNVVWCLSIALLLIMSSTVFDTGQGANSLYIKHFV